MPCNIYDRGSPKLGHVWLRYLHDTCVGVFLPQQPTAVPVADISRESQRAMHCKLLVRSFRLVPSGSNAHTMRQVRPIRRLGTLSEDIEMEEAGMLKRVTVQRKHPNRH